MVLESLVARPNRDCKRFVVTIELYCNVVVNMFTATFDIVSLRYAETRSAYIPVP